MSKYFRLGLFVAALSFQVIPVEAGKRGMFSVSSFGRFSIDENWVDFDQVHLNLARFEAHASSQISSDDSTNNIAVGAITVFFGEETIPGDGNTIKGVYPFFFEMADQGEGRKLLAFESTPSEGEEDITWGHSGLGFISGHSSMVQQPSTIKSLCFKKMYTFFQQMNEKQNEDFWDEEVDSTLNPLLPLSKMKVPLGILTTAALELQKTRASLCKTLSPLGPLSDAYKLLFEEEPPQKHTAQDIELIPSFGEVEISDDGEEATKVRDYIFKNNPFSVADKMLEDLDSLQDVIESVPAQVEKFKKSIQNVKTTATKVYNECWHSEQRLFHFLFSNLIDEDDTSTSSEQLILQDDKPVTLLPNPGETTFNWDALASLGGDLQPKMIFLHIHSRLNFCDMCRYTLAEVAPKLMNKVTSFPGNWQLGGILGSYRLPYSGSSLDSVQIGTIPWGEKEPSFSLHLLKEKLEAHRSEDKIPSLYLKEIRL